MWILVIVYAALVALRRKPLVDVSKIQVLAIGHIAESSRVKVPSFQSAFLLALQLISTFVLHAQDSSECNNDTCFNQVRDDHAPYSKGILRFLARNIEERTCNVAGTVTQEDDCIGDHFLRMSSCVCDGHGEDHDKRGVVWSCQVIANQPSSFVVIC